MELGLNRTDINYFELVQDNACSREETLEMIVPDACPDIIKIVDTYAFCCLTRREMGDSGGLLAGTVKATVLYAPEGEGGLRKLEAEIPFQHLHECVQADSSCCLQASAWVVTAETRIINPRKVLIRVDLRENVQIYRPQIFCVCGELSTEMDFGIQQRVEHYQTAFAVQPMEKVFQLEEEINLNAGRSGSGTILRVCPRAYCSEARLIGSKLVLKGEVLLRILCQGEGGELFSSDVDLPLSQMLETGNAGTEAVFRVELQVIRWELGTPSVDGRSIPISMELAAQAVFYENVPVAMVTDAYSVYYPLTLQEEMQSFQRITDSTKRQTIREFVESEASIRTVCDSHIELGVAQISREGEQCTIQIPAEATVLTSCEDGSCSSVQYKFALTLQQALPADSKLSCRYSVIQLEALPAAAGIELRGVAEIQMQVRQSFQVTGLAGAELDREHPLDHTGQPSVVLRRPGAGESLWEIAKRYSTTCQEICAANGLSEDQTLGTQMLLIPRKR